MLTLMLLNGRCNDLYRMMRCFSTAEVIIPIEKFDAFSVHVKAFSSVDVMFFADRCKDL